MEALLRCLLGGGRCASKTTLRVLPPDPMGCASGRSNAVPIALPHCRRTASDSATGQISAALTRCYGEKASGGRRLWETL